PRGLRLRAAPGAVVLAHERALRRRHLPELAVDDGDRPARAHLALDDLIAELLLVGVALAIAVEDPADRRVAPVHDADARVRIEVLLGPDEDVAAPLLALHDL